MNEKPTGFAPTPLQLSSGLADWLRDLSATEQFRATMSCLEDCKQSTIEPEERAVIDLMMRATEAKEMTSQVVV